MPKLAATLLLSVAAHAATCESLARLALPHTTVTTAASVPAGSFTPPGAPPLKDLPAFCRAAGVLQPSSDSHIEFEVWLPASGWNGKFQGIGNGGYAGAISFAGLANAVRHSYATASTDTGHRAGGTNAGWALDHPEKIVDFGYRAIHETAVTAKALIRAFYGEAPRRSYFNSCSNGGRQALMEAQRFPADYDGIIAGAPANDWTHLLSLAAWDMQATLQDPASYIPAGKLGAIQGSALAACDALDGVKDGVIGDPARCHPDPARLLCRGPDTDACLTLPQVAALRILYGGLPKSKAQPGFPGYSPGGEAEPGGWASWITGAAPEKSLMYAFGTQFYKNMVYRNPAWDFRTFDADRDVKAADVKTASSLNATNPDLRRFQQRGGKLILYHGWSDAAIPAQSTVNYYRSVLSKMGEKQAAGFVRLFMVPGMQHCGGGSGPDFFGQAGVAEGDALHNIDAALERWVEQGIAPEQLIAAHRDASGAVTRTRPLCPYPQEARWKGTGSTDDASNFTCAAPK